MTNDSGLFLNKEQQISAPLLQANLRLRCSGFASHCVVDNARSGKMKDFGASGNHAHDIAKLAQDILLHLQVGRLVLTQHIGSNHRQQITAYAQH